MSESTAPLLEVRGITKQYPGVMALKGMDFDVRAGEVHCLLGPNGAGKSTLIKCISGVHAPTEGQILIEGKPLPVGEPSQSMALGIGTIYQELDLVEDLRVAESIFLGHEPRRLGLLDRAKMRADTTALLTRLEHADIKPDMFVRQLRPAAQQIVSIARALSRNVKLLIMDEPSAILDDGEVETLFDVVRKLTADGVGVIYISHRLDEIPRIGDRVTVLSDGRTVATGLPADTPRAELVEKMVGRKVDQLFPTRAKAAADADVVLDVRGVSGAPRVKESSFQVRAGEVLGIGGLVGAGRSELLRLVYGLDKPDTGEVYLDGKKVPAGNPAVAIERGMGLAPEDRKSQGLLLGWSLAKNVSVADLSRFTTGGIISLREERKLTGEKLRELNTVPDNPNRITRELSGGNQQKVVLARWLLRECRVLLLDEPTRGVDVGAKAEIYRLIAELSAAGIAVVVVSSEMEELMGLSSRILIMREGELVAEVDGETATEVELLSHAVAPTDTNVVLEETR
ncbi:monosaccharide ABC transporter ATP-binding protein (CUT2 family) [Solirubrobacter pauli]|uniref:Monosaccharide ABC transporter ATP-binding protein (CUT2 family) n=1 Tax=Solirubrobacter pauli TaxID=166793 RepID=A0A660L9Q3_9ACTN|nr:sugar ABC transporter ATP-binding protein [Solirubrobacter pauli]RKQ88270.1 monosaccharide ABC transporter ATP-binding protein (CUT2 family) [Solirubrobacter pauli]